jgi:hypothetical protein
VKDLVTNRVAKATMTLSVNQVVTPRVVSLVRVPQAIGEVNLNDYVLSPVYGTPGYLYTWYNNSQPRVEIEDPVATPILNGLNKFNLVLSSGLCVAPEKMVTVFRSSARFSGEFDEPLVSPNGEIVAFAYPVPTNGTFTLNVLTEADKDLEIRILNLVGQEVCRIATVSDGAKSTRAGIDISHVLHTIQLARQVGRGNAFNPFVNINSSKCLPEQKKTASGATFGAGACPYLVVCNSKPNHALSGIVQSKPSSLIRSVQTKPSMQGMQAKILSWREMSLWCAISCQYAAQIFHGKIWCTIYPCVAITAQST